MMKRLQKNRDRAERLLEGRAVCGRIRKLVGKYMEASTDCIPTKSSDNKYEVSSFDGSKYIVDLEDRTCACRKWDLSGIPCKHAISAICAKGKVPEDYVHSCYYVETYCSVYEHAISPMNGDQLWAVTGYIPPLPPSFAKKKKGRPQKERRFGPDDEEQGRKKRSSSTVERLGKQYHGITCGFCGENGHNQLGCKMRNENFLFEATPPQLEQDSATTQPSTRPEEVTQHDGPPSTQEDEATQVEASSSILPTTLQGRKKLARKRPRHSNKPVGDAPVQEKATAYTISSEIDVVQSSGVEPHVMQPPAGFDSPKFIGGSSFAGNQTQVQEIDSMRVVTRGGRSIVDASKKKRKKS